MWKLGVSWCCGNYCLLAFVLWCGYCSVSFQSFVLRHWCPQHQETTWKLDTLSLVNLWQFHIKLMTSKSILKKCKCAVSFKLLLWPNIHPSPTVSNAWTPSRGIKFLDILRFNPLTPENVHDERSLYLGTNDNIMRLASIYSYCGKQITTYTVISKNYSKLQALQR